MALTTTFEKFAKQQKESNPNITDAEIEQLWSQQPLNKRIASGIESAVLTPARAIASIPETVGAGYKKLDEFSRSGPDLSFKYEGGNKAVIAGKPNQATSAPLEQPPSAKEQPAAETKTLTESLQDKSTPEVKKEVKKAVAATDTTAKEAQKAADKGEIPQSVADSYKTQRDEAYRRYDEAKERNEWLELAQLLGQAATQFGAAQIGMRTGRSMAGLQIPGVDYGARTEREAKLLQTRLGDIEEQQKAEQKEKELEQDRQYRTLKLALDRQELEDRKAERAGRMSAEERLEKTTLRDSINKDLAAAQKQYQAALTFANQAAMEKDLSPKSLKKIEEKAPGLLAQAGIQPAELQQIEKEATDKGWIWDTVDPKKKQQLIQERILDKQTNIIQGLKAQLGQLAGRSAGQTPPPSGTVKIQAPDGTIAEVPADKAQKYIDKGGKIVQ